ncbi:type I restriction endonuclease subunit R [Actinomadura sp. NTSP31]|uniref:type I restriction endonuclease subunit R n=1 Tax=Actinomadura sp. NTSP31 TaxID=1735447 RepID=UPI0035BF1393
MIPRRSSGKMSEADWESLALEHLDELSWVSKTSKDVAPGSGSRASWDDLILRDELRAAIERLNPELPPQAVREAFTIAVTAKSREPLEENRLAHEYVTAGIRITYTDEFGAEITPTVRLIELRNPNANTYHAVNQVLVKEGEHERRFDVVLYVNGLPVVVMELKSAADEHATLKDAHAQLQTYVNEFPLAFRYNVLCLISDGITAKYGTPFTPYEHFAPWNINEDGTRVDTNVPDYDGEEALVVALYGLFSLCRFLHLTAHFVNFTPAGKRIAKPHQYHAVTTAVEKIVEASRRDGKAGVVWHTQGSGKSEEMVCTAGMVSSQPALNNPTIVVITDRNDLDDQLYGTFQDSQGLLGQHPLQVETREELREELIRRRTGGIIFTTLQKFGLTRVERDSGMSHPLLSNRRNIIVMVDEAHRSHYDSIDGYARHLRDALPNATLIAFTGTPISEVDRNTRVVFGPYIDIYDLKRAVDDGATVRVYHEPRLIPVTLPPGVNPEALDKQADALTEKMDDAERRKALAYATQMTNIYGAPGRIKTLAADLVSHWEARSDLMRPQLGGPGKSMIVCVTREVCVRLFDAIYSLRPGWVDPAVDKGKMKIVFHSDPSDPDHLKAHALRPAQHKTVQARAKDIDDELELIIVHSMLITGYDAPPIHTLYMDRPMHGANLMQALARVNRRFRSKEDGLLVGYAPLTDNLKKALREYTPSDQKDQTLGRDLDRAFVEIKNDHSIICDLLSGIDWRRLLAQANAAQQRPRALRRVVNHLRDPRTAGNQVEPGEKSLSDRFKEIASRLERFYRLCASSRDFAEKFDDAASIRGDIAFFSEVRAWIVKLDAADREASGKPLAAEVSIYLSQLAASAVEASEITDLYAEAGIGHLDITELNDVHLHKLQESETPHLAAEALRRLIEQKMREVTKHNIIRRESFSEQLQDLMIRYMKQQLTSAEMIAELVAMAKEVSADARRGETFEPPLSVAELAFYDAVANHGIARAVMGDDILAEIARTLVADIRKNLSVDWLSREPVRAKLRTRVRRLLAKFDYPPEEEREAVELVIKQMETFAADWAPASEG